MATMNANNQNNFIKLTQANATLSGPNAKISSEIEAIQKMVATLARQVYTMNITNNKSGGSGGKPNTYIHHLPLPQHTADHKDGASILSKNIPERGLGKLIQQQKIIIRVETHGVSDTKVQLLL